MVTLGFLTSQPSQPHILRDYDPEADVLYLSIGDPKPAIGVDIGEGIVVRYDPDSDQVVGFTVLGLQTRLKAELES